jgi:prepilin-type N-terminal cleavage/methylation domain-containing protein
MSSSSPLTRIKNRLRSAASGDDGFTLTEVIVSFVIFAIVATAATVAVVGGTKSTQLTNNRVTAANVAQQSLQQAQAMPRASLTATGPASPTHGNAQYSVSGFAVTRTIGYVGGTSCPNGIDASAKHEITVHVVVTPATSGRPVAMDTVIAC